MKPRFVCRQPDATFGGEWLVMAQLDVAAGPGGGPMFAVESTHDTHRAARDAMLAMDPEAATREQDGTAENHGGA